MKIQILLSQVYCVWLVVKTPKITLNNTVYIYIYIYIYMSYWHDLYIRHIGNQWRCYDCEYEYIYIFIFLLTMTDRDRSAHHLNSKHVVYWSRYLWDLRCLQCYHDYNLNRCDAVQFGGWVLMFWKKLLTPDSWYRNNNWRLQCLSESRVWTRICDGLCYTRR